MCFSFTQANQPHNSLDFTTTKTTRPKSIKSTATQYFPHTKQQKQVPIKLQNRNKGKFSWEFGIGYVESWFNARQRFAEPLVIFADGSVLQELSKDKSRADGVDLYFNGNCYIKERFGWIFGVGMEFIDIKWKNGGLVKIPYYGTGLEASKSDFLYAMYYYTGFFGDVWQHKNHSLRLFGTIGVSIDFLFGGLYEKEEQKCNGIVCTPTYTSIYDTKDKTISATFPIQLGLRYSFATGHGIEVFGKYHASSWNFTQAHNSAIPNLHTNISRGASAGVRYVYEYKYVF